MEEDSRNAEWGRKKAMEREWAEAKWRAYVTDTNDAWKKLTEQEPEAQEGHPRYMPTNTKVAYTMGEPTVRMTRAGKRQAIPGSWTGNESATGDTQLSKTNDFARPRHAHGAYRKIKRRNKRKQVSGAYSGKLSGQNTRKGQFRNRGQQKIRISINRILDRKTQELCKGKEPQLLSHSERDAIS